MKKSKKEVVLFLVEILLTILYLMSFSIFAFYILKLNIIPTKYLIGGFTCFLLFLLILLWFLFNKKRKILKGIAAILIVITSGVFIFGTSYLSSTYTFFKNTKKEYDTLTYSVLVLNDSSYNTLENLKNKKILYLNNEYKEEIKKELVNKISYEEILSEGFGSVPSKLLSHKVDAIVLEESFITLAYKEINQFKESTKVIYTFAIEVKAYEENKEEENPILGNTEEPEERPAETPATKTPNSFILYISGIDQYGNVNSVSGLSDVNQIVVVNLDTNHILLVNTPRDYYIQLAGTIGYKDKLTHAGVYGIKMSIKTLENFYNIRMNYYVRVNFNTLIQMVDVIGGVDINSDTAFTAHTNASVYVTQGWNHFNGTQALAYARERYAYAGGDRHRGENQQQVITAIFKKLTTSSVLISKYNSILNTLSGSFQTNMPMNKISSLIKYQLDKMPQWNIESISVTGSDSENYTYSMGEEYWLYVMEPDMASVNNAKQRIRSVLNES